MATFDQLSAEQRAIIELVLKQGQSYDELSDMLGLSTDRVRELAKQALVRLSPVSAGAVGEDWQAQLADYLLNQQSGPEATATRGHLRRSESARGWARSVLDSLEQFYDEKNIPTVPEGDARPERERKPARERSSARPRSELSPDAQAAVRRRRLLGGVGAAAALLLVLVLTVLPGVGPLDLTGDDEGSSEVSSGGGEDDTEGAAQADEVVPETAAETEAENAPARLVGQLPLAPVEGLEGDETAGGEAGIVVNGETLQLVVQARLPVNAEMEAYEVWFYNSDEDALSVGAQVADPKGVFSGAQELPKGYGKYKFIDISREPVDGPEEHSGDSVLRGRFADFQAAEAEAGDGAQPPAQQPPQPEQPAPQP